VWRLRGQTSRTYRGRGRLRQSQHHCTCPSHLHLPAPGPQSLSYSGLLRHFRTKLATNPCSSWLEWGCNCGDSQYWASRLGTELAITPSFYAFSHACSLDTVITTAGAAVSVSADTSNRYIRPGFLAKGRVLKQWLSRIQGWHTCHIEEAVAIFCCALSQSSHTEFWGFSNAKPDLYLQICKKIESKFEFKINHMQFLLPAAPLDLWMK